MSDILNGESNVTDADIERVFENTNFGASDHRKLLGASVFKKLVGYHCGFTITSIMEQLGLIGRTGKPTKKGIEFVRHAYSNILRVSG